MKYCTLLLFILSCTSLYAHAESRYPVSELADSLKKNAHAVIRYDKTELEILDLKQVKSIHKYAITILDEQGKYLADIQEQYSQLSKIESIKGKLFDASGKELKSMKLKDMNDFSSLTVSFTFHDDTRFKSFSFNCTRYPYTVEFEVEELLKTTFFLPRWKPQVTNYAAIAEADFTLVYPGTFAIREKEYLMPADVVREEKTESGKIIKTWRLNNIKAYDFQPRSREGNFSNPTITLAPGDFQLMDYKGNMETWKNLGRFIYELNNGRDVLPEDKKAAARAIAGQEPDFKKKIQLLYEYMQQHTRYVANEYGIAGWQTFDAANVGKNGYGDCKGLTNYMKAILQEAGIKSYAALIHAGDEDYYKVDTAFSSNNFNHVILCIPAGNDSIWLECTSQQLPAGYLGGFTQNRYALLVTEDGGVLCKTPSYGKDKSYILRNMTMNFEKGSKQQTLRLTNKYSGILQDDLLNSLKIYPEHKIKEELNTKFSFPSYSITDFKYEVSPPRALPYIVEDATAIVTGIITGTTKRTFISLSWIGNPMEYITQQNKRTEPLVLAQSLHIVDTVTITLPPDISVESVPKGQIVTYPFAVYSTEVVKSPQTVTVIRSYEQNEGTYPVSDFENYQKLYNQIETDKNKLSLVLLNE